MKGREKTARGIEGAINLSGPFYFTVLTQYSCYHVTGNYFSLSAGTLLLPTLPVLPPFLVLSLCLSLFLSLHEHLSKDPLPNDSLPQPSQISERNVGQRFSALSCLSYSSLQVLFYTCIFHSQHIQYQSMYRELIKRVISD